MNCGRLFPLETSARHMKMVAREPRAIMSKLGNGFMLAIGGAK